VSRELAGILAQVVAELPGEQVRMLAERLSPGVALDDARWSWLATLVPTPAFASAVARLRGAGGLDAGSLRLALLTAVEVANRERARQSVEIVWTGPETRQVPVRQTRAALIEVIRAARERLVLVSFAAYQVSDVCAEVEASAGRDVDVRLVLEDESMDGAAAFSSLRGRATFWVWPAERRPALPSGRASLHAKAAIADGRVALVTSANLTGHGIGANMELGLLVRGGPVPARLAAHLAELMESGTLARVG
jgi:phosphatidylserine/phosphatidylglycerophosphate/cardiolipin synthase-like enzyme